MAVGGGVCNGSAHSRHLVNSRHCDHLPLYLGNFQSPYIQLAPPPANTSLICTPSFRVPILTDFPRHLHSRGLNLKIVKVPTTPTPQPPITLCFCVLSLGDGNPFSLLPSPPLSQSDQFPKLAPNNSFFFIFTPLF